MRHYLRDRNSEHGARVTNIELFFDLVFVFAVTQLSHLLLHDLTPLGAARAAIVFLATWWVWIYTSWVTNWLNPEHWPVRVALIALMLGGLILSTSLPMAFGTKGLAFGGAYVAMQVGRSLFMLWALGDAQPGNTRNFQRITIWLSGTGTLWICGGLADGNTRLALWLVALAIETAGPLLGFRTPGLDRSRTRDWDVAGEHIAERCSLFIIISLGEQLVVTGATVADQTLTLLHVAAFNVAFVGTVAFWWIYFDTGAERGSQKIAQAEDPGHLARILYTYIHVVIVGGIIVSAVGDDLLLAHPGQHPTTAPLIATVGGALLFLVGNMLFKGVERGYPPPSHLVGIGALCAIVAVALFGGPNLFVINALTNGVLCVVAGWEAWSLRFESSPDHA